MFNKNIKTDKVVSNTKSVINLKQCNRKPSKELMESLQEIEDYKNGKVELSSFDNTDELFKYLDKK